MQAERQDGGSKQVERKATSMGSQKPVLRGLSEPAAVRTATDFPMRKERHPTQKGKKYHDSVFGLMAFFPIVIRKVGGYVALHDEINAQWTLCARLLRDSEGKGACVRYDDSAGGNRAS